MGAVGGCVCARCPPSPPARLPRLLHSFDLEPSQEPCWGNWGQISRALIRLNAPHFTRSHSPPGRCRTDTSCVASLRVRQRFRARLHAAFLEILQPGVRLHRTVGPLSPVTQGSHPIGGTRVLRSSVVQLYLSQACWCRCCQWALVAAESAGLCTGPLSWMPKYSLASFVTLRSFSFLVFFFFLTCSVHTISINTNIKIQIHWRHKTQPDQKYQMYILSISSTSFK